MANKKILAKRFLFLFVFIIVISIVINQFFPNLSFTYKSLIIISRIIVTISFIALFYCTAILLNAGKRGLIFLAIILLVIFGISLSIQLNPIDTTTEPTEIATLEQSDGKKIIIREYKNVKTTEKIVDTVIVKDYFIFRQFLKNL